MYERTLLENERGERFHLVTILLVLLAEALHHKTLLYPSLQAEGKPANQNAGKTTYPASLERRTEHPQQNAAVDGVADNAIGTGVHERVILLHSHTVAPIAAEHEAGLDAEGNPRQHREKAHDRDGYSYGE
jgi:hypothetical protein